MNVDQRLHRAAHDLREIDVVAPPFTAPSATRSRTSLRRFGAPVAAVMLFALGAVATMSELAPAATTAGQAATNVTVADQRDPSVPTLEVARQLSAREEVALISALSRVQPTVAIAGVSATPIDASIPPGAS